MLQAVEFEVKIRVTHLTCEVEEAGFAVLNAQLVVEVLNVEINALVSVFKHLLLIKVALTHAHVLQFHLWLREQQRLAVRSVRR